MLRRSTVRRVEEFVLFDVLYEDGTRTSNRKVPGSELVDIEVDLLAKTYIEGVPVLVEDIEKNELLDAGTVERLAMVNPQNVVPQASTNCRWRGETALVAPDRCPTMHSARPEALCAA